MADFSVKRTALWCVLSVSSLGLTGLIVARLARPSAQAWVVRSPGTNHPASAGKKSDQAGRAGEGFSGRGITGSPGLPRLSDDDQRALRSIEEVLRTGDAEHAEGVFGHCLPGLLADGGEALAERLLAEAPPGFLRETLRRTCELVWPKVDPDAALAWLARRSDPVERAEAYERVLASLATVNPARAVDMAAQRDASEGSALAPPLVSAWAAEDFRAARRWALGLPPGDQRDRCVAAVATVEARSFPAEAADFALKRLPPGPVRDEAVITTVYYWAERSAPAARHWVENFPEGDLRERALREVNGGPASGPDQPDGSAGVTASP